MATIDHAFHTLRSLGGRLRFFRKGWGAVHQHDEWLKEVRQCVLTAPTLNITYRRLLPTLTLGTFLSPAAHFLPCESRTARFLYVHPSISHSVPFTTPHPTVLLLAATGDHGFLRRFLCFSWYLRRNGIASIILESAFYGTRQPPMQRGARLECVAHLADLGRATIEEGAALLTHLYERGVERLAVAGISQGGLHAAMTASQTKFCVPVVMAFAPHSAAPVFTDGVLARSVDWNALENDPTEPSLARHDLRQVLQQSSIENFPEHGYSARHVLVFARSDG